MTKEKVTHDVIKYFRTMRSNYKSQSGPRQVEKENRKIKNKLRNRKRRETKVCLFIHVDLLLIPRQTKVNPIF
jgi:hypothetical protein